MTAEQTIRSILSKYIGEAANSVGQEEDFWRKFPDDNGKFLSKRQKEFSNEICTTFNKTLTESDWEDAVSISALAEILEKGGLGADKKIKNLELNIAASQKGIKIASIFLLPLSLALMLFRIKQGIVFLFLYIFAAGLNYILIRQFKRDVKRLQKQSKS